VNHRTSIWFEHCNERRAERISRALMRAGRLAAIFTACGGCFILFGYASGAEWIVRPLADGPISHPLTALLFIVGGTALLFVRPFCMPAASAATLICVGVVAAFRLVGILFGVPDGRFFMFDWGGVGPIGVHAAMRFLLVSTSFTLRYLGYPRSSQAVAVAGMAPSLVSLTGYLYGIAIFYGAMSLTTTIIGLAFSATPFLLGARVGFMRALCSPWDGGRYGRFQIFAITTVLFLGGIIVQRQTAISGAAVVPAFVVTATLVLSLVSAYCTILTERNDYARRIAERLVANHVLHDPLTGLHNRRFLNEQADGISAFARRQGIALSVLMVDVDHFKGVNDAFGHQVGDLVLQRIAGALRARLRRGDIAVRYGGEELLVVLMGADLEVAESVAEDIRSMIASQDLSALGPQRVTVSVGVAEVTASIADAGVLADAALYEAKRSGRNRVQAAATPRRPNLRLATAG
jgi:diguanylate cyclase (GGDEF)-like protein